jgi:integrase
MGMGRSRSAARSGWPAHLYACGDGFKYRHPVTKKDTWMGKDRARAFEAARKLNAILMPGNDLVDRVTKRGETIADAVRVFLAEDMPGRKWAPKTAETYGSVLKRIEAEIGDRDCAGFAVRDCATFVRDITEGARARQQFRLVLGWVMACAVEEGWIEINPALQIRKAYYERRRARLTEDAYKAIWAAAPGWLRNAMDLSLLTLLRREDVVSARFADVRDGALWIVPGKTEGTTGARLKIKTDGDLADVIARCRDDVLSPYLVHRLPEKARPKQKRARDRDHHTQVLPEQLSRAFAAARVDAKIGGENPPTFHEIRSLGGFLLREKNGWTVAQVQALMAHSDATMTQHYLDGHEQPWTEISLATRIVSQSP